MPTREEIERLISDEEKELARLDAKRAALITRLQSLRRDKRILVQPGQQFPLEFQSIPVTNQSSEQEKIALFKSLFRGREDIFPLRFESAKTGKQGYQPACGNEWAHGICHKPKIKCGDCDNQAFLPVNEMVLRNHLMGRDVSASSSKDFTVGVYPLLLDNTCWFLAIDFDKESWQEDVSAFIETCQMYDVPAALERSRSGNGGHAWIFFAEPIKAKTARNLGTFLLTRTMESRPEIGFASYDRLFPNQDTLPQGGFGNLIALPLQKKPRESGNSVFVDEQFEPFQDQWAFLSSIRRMFGTEVEEIVGKLDSKDLIEIDHVFTEEHSPWKLSPSRKKKNDKITSLLPKKLELVLNDQIYLDKKALTPPLRNCLIRLAAFQNPEFYRAQAMRFSTFNIPRVIICAEDFPTHIGLPRGCLDDVIELLKSNNIKFEITDKRFAGNPIDLSFQGQLHVEQQAATEALLKNDTGVLAATTAFGKTVVAIYLLAKRNVPTLILVHRHQLMDQWKAHLISFLGLSSKEVGQIGGGKRKITGIVDIAMIQSLYKKGEVDDIVGEYGHVIVDECHHVSARSFELVVRRSKAKYVTGLSATVTRKDGQHPIIFMQCGPVRYHVDPRTQAAKRSFKHRVLIRKTNFRLDYEIAGEQQPPKIHEIYRALMTDDDRNALIVSDILKALEDKRFPIVLTERREHLNRLSELLYPKTQNIIIMKGRMGKRQREHAKALLNNIADDETRIILATGRFIGEGFDDHQLDTLFLTLPISWRGTLTQYVGRLHREHAQKDEVIIYDYFDENIAMLERMYQKRIRGYKALGYDIEE